MVPQKTAWAVARVARARIRRKFTDSLVACAAVVSAVVPTFAVAAASTAGAWPNRPIRVLLPSMALVLNMPPQRIPRRLPLPCHDSRTCGRPTARAPTSA